MKRIIAEKPQKLNFGIIARSGFSARFRASFCGERFARLARLAFGLELVAEKPKVQNKRKTQNWEKVKRVKKAFSLKRNLSVKRIIAEKP